jgi:pyruvate formate lyase activating enzyme
MQREGRIFDIRRFSVHDGPGIRTTVFLAGCPLRCWWCHNPEAAVVDSDDEARVEGLRAERGAARAFVGTFSVDTIMAEVARDIPYYESSGGGVTFSGGEPFAQPAFLASLLRRCRDLGLHTAVDTCGCAEPADVRALAPLVGLYLYDLKLADDAQSRSFTGASNQLTKANLELLAEVGAAVQLRFPYVPGITATAPNLEAWMDFVLARTPYRRISLLPYHRGAMEKYRRLELEYRLGELPEPSTDELEHARARLEARGFEVTIGA